MIYFTLYENEIVYNNVKDKLIDPNVSVILGDNDTDTVIFKEPRNYSKEYLTFDITSAGTITWDGYASPSSNSLSYSLDNGTTWLTAADNTSISVDVGDKILWKGSSMKFYDNGGIGNFISSSSVKYDVSGNIMSLLYGDNFVNQISLSGKNYAFYNLFNGNNIINAKKLILPATTLSTSCYDHMFYDCQLLISAP